MKTAKAVVAAMMAGLTALSTGLTDGKLTAQEAIVAAIALVTTYGATWTVPNAGVVSSAVLDREVRSMHSRYSRTSYAGGAGTPPDAEPLPKGERPPVE
jgi:hypothetical protein